MIRSAQDSRVEGREVFKDLRKTGWGAVQQLGTGSSYTSADSMGNFETVPPHSVNGKTYPAGRVITGQHGNKPFLLPFFEAQEVQDPILLDTSWLYVGHVDEFMQFLPTQSPRGWVIMADDPGAGLELLRRAQAGGYGSTNLFSRQKGEAGPKCGKCHGGWRCRPEKVPGITINEILRPAKRSWRDLVKTNERCAAKIENNLDNLKRTTGITEDEIHRISALYETAGFGIYPYPPKHEPERSQALSYIPGIINGRTYTHMQACNTLSYGVVR